MRFAYTDIQRIYRHAPNGAPCEAIRVSHPLGAVWYAGRDRVFAPRPTRASTPWMQIGWVPDELTDGVEDNLVVADAELARHALAWRVKALANRGNLFVALAVELGPRVREYFGDRHVTLVGVVEHPLAEPRFLLKEVVVGQRARAPTAEERRVLQL